MFSGIANIYRHPASRRKWLTIASGLFIAVLSVIGLLFGTYTGRIHMPGGMVVYQLSVLIVIANGMRLLRVPEAARVRPPAQVAARVAA